ncbi:MAG TPA: TolC family outer membrane protein [Sphingobium sp.]|uniref:TolC family outer membrane protein n=1 Tax=Sphingobium sp. TaxID=1912891 RepID=UPI002ED2D4FF
MKSMSRFKALALTAVSLSSLAQTARAETLMDALVKAYRSNPTLTGARASQRGVDEDVAIAKADGRPSASISGSYNEQIARTPQLVSTGVDFVSIQTTPPRNVTGQGSLNVPIYSGGTVRNAVNAAKLRVESGQNNLRGTESSIFSQVVGAYMDVIRDSQIVLLNAQNVGALEVNLRASRDRFEVGDLTRTDVAQSDSRLALARASYQRAQAQLISSKESYTALVGTPPDTLETPPGLPGLPDTPEVAVSVALSDNPDIRAAQKARDAARYDVKSAQGAVLPRLSAFTNGSYTDYLNTENNLIVGPYNKSAQAGATLTVPLYQGGRPGANQRQAVARESAAIEQSIQAERGVIAQVRSAYAIWKAALLNIESTRTAASAADLSLEGVKAENSVGTRTVLDILNAEQEQLNARVQLVTAERDAYVAAFTLIAAMGHAEARDLGLDPTALYDPNDNYKRVRNKLFDFDFASKPGAASTSTRDTRSQTATPITVPAN